VNFLSAPGGTAVSRYTLSALYRNKCSRYRGSKITDH